jgi:N-terminal domain of galactosyltransferase
MTGPAHQDKAVSHDFGHSGQLAHPRTSRANWNDVNPKDPNITVSLIVPWRGGDPMRERLWDFCRQYWTSHYPDFELIECDSGDEPFTRGRSINQGVEQATADYLVIADADTLVAHIDEALLYAGHGEWVIAYPQGQYYALTEKATESFLETDPAGQLKEPTREEWRERITSYSGVLVMPRAAFDCVGGFAHQFVGWGAEDVALMFALDTLWKPCVRASGYAIAPWHPHLEEDRFQQPHYAANDALCKRFENCFGNPSAMRHLITELGS